MLNVFVRTANIADVKVALVVLVPILEINDCIKITVHGGGSFWPQSPLTAPSLLL
jgi:hypothetical protein